MNEQLINQEEVLDFFSTTINEDRVASSYLFTGERGVGKFAGAIQLAKMIKCANKDPETLYPCNTCKVCHQLDSLRHPDLEVIFPLPSHLGKPYEKLSSSALEELKGIIETKSRNKYRFLKFNKQVAVRIEIIRELIDDKLNQTSSEKGGRIVVIVDAHHVLIEAANAFLKTLEEPPEETYLILTTHQPQQLLPTIRSRTQRVHFKNIAPDVIIKYLLEHEDVDHTTAELAAKVAVGSVGQALEFIDPTYQQLRNLAIEGLNRLFQDDLEALIVWLENIDNQNKLDLYENAAELLSVLYSITNDAVIYHATSDPNLMKNIDLLDFQTQINARGYSIDQLFNLNKHLDMAITEFNSNPNKELHLLNTFLKAQKILITN